MRITIKELRSIVRQELLFLKENLEKKKIFVLVGPPSVGKSTWINSAFKDNRPFIINRDDIVEKVASSNGLTYDDMFVNPPANSQIGDEDPKYGKVVNAPSWMTWTKVVFDKVQNANDIVQKTFNARLSQAPISNQDIVVDMTNMNAAARKSALNAIKGNEQDFEKIAVVFEFEGAENIIKKIAQKRAESAKRMGKSKTIPDAAFDRMFSAFSRPTPEEGFDTITSVDNRELLKQIINK
jgi:hypothetical protein